MRLYQNLLTFSLAITLGILTACNGSPVDSATHAELNDLKNKSEEQQKAIQELSTQVRTLNEEGNRLKSLVSQLTDGVLAQKQTIQNLAQPRAVAPVAPKPTHRPAPRPTSRIKTTSKRSLSKPPTRSTSRKPTPKPSPKRRR